MSDVLRTYGGKATGASARRRRSGSRPVRTLLILGGLALLFYGYWTTRDTVSMERLIPAGHAYEVEVTDLLSKRARIAESQVWAALPESIGLGGAPALLKETLGLPDWVLNNLVGEHCYFSGDDLKTFSDVLLVTKMQPVGVLLERLHWLGPNVSHDACGGLQLRAVAQAGVYYAVRGRILVASRSRAALIRALTVQEQDSLLAHPPTSDANTEFGAEDLRGVITPAPDDPVGAYVKSLRFAVRIDPTHATLKCQAELSDAWRERLAPVLGNAVPQPLTTPLEGILAVSANFGRPVKELALGLGAAVPWPLLSAEQWAKWEATPPEGPGLAQMLTLVAGPLGPGIRLSWCGADLNEILPIPLLAGTVDAGGASIDDLFASVPGPPTSAQPWESHPRYDRDAKLISDPLIGGPSLEPTAAALGDTLLLSTSRTLADDLLARAQPRTTLPEPGNLFVQIKPRPCAESIADAARLFAASNLLKGYTPESLEQEAGKWLDEAAKISEVRLQAAHQDGEITVQADVECVPDQP